MSYATISCIIIPYILSPLLLHNKTTQFAAVLFAICGQIAAVSIMNNY